MGQFCPEFEVALFVYRKLLVQREVKLAQSWSVESKPSQVAELARLRKGERSGVQEIAFVASTQERIIPPMFV